MTVPIDAPVSPLSGAGLPSPIDAVADMRAAAKWTIAAFAVVGAFILGGVPVAVIGKLQDRGDAVAVAAGIMTALLGVSWAVWHTTEALTPPITTIASLRDPRLKRMLGIIESDPAAFFGGFGTDEKSLRESLVMHATMVSALSLRLAKECSEEQRRVWALALDDARANLAGAQYAQQRLLAIIYTWQVREALRRARLQTLTGVALSAVGALVFLSAVVR
ncbi:hypothetical protein ABZU25_07320 [Micromonospora sp. NPDC005215]|uniref:hypothetical protein n=1 Tax=Micromonospora sp. NPDC005215 TaxID=3157024 RepID=UPI0033A1A721